MNIFIDTEFTDLSREARLISLGAVSEDGQEFYCELPVDPKGCSPFVRGIVLPLLDGGAASCSQGDFAARLGTWLERFDEPVLLSDSDWDILVMRKALMGEASRMPGPLCLPGGRTVIMTTLMPLAGEDLALFDSTMQGHFAGDPRQHHALVDARALRAGLLAVMASREGLSRGQRWPVVRRRWLS
jgi:hypothetical protein